MLPIVATALTLLIAAQGATRPLPDLCAGPEDGQPLTLTEVWEAGRDLEPGYDAVEQATAAVGADLSAIRRERLPELGVEAAGDQGRRARPGEERAIGIGARGDVRALAGWTILDSGRGWRETEAARRAEEMRRAGDVFDADFRGAVGRTYVDAAVEAARRALLLDERGGVAELARIVGLRREAGVEIEYDSFLIEEALARFDRRLTEAAFRAEAARDELALLAGRCVRPTPIQPRPGEVPTADVAANPRVRLLRQQASAQEAAAGAVLRQDLWRLQVIGAAGPYISQAFPDGPVEPEYIVGLSATWTPDLAGVRRARAAAETARALSLGHEADSAERTAERELGRLALTFKRFDERRRELARERELTERRSDAAELRWTAGVDRWREVVDARERLLDVRLAELELEREIAHALIAFGEWAGELDALPRWLDQEVAP